MASNRWMPGSSRHCCCLLNLRILPNVSVAPVPSHTPLGSNKNLKATHKNINYFKHQRHFYVHSKPNFQLNVFPRTILSAVLHRPPGALCGALAVSDSPLQAWPELMEQSFHVPQQCGTGARQVVQSVSPAIPLTREPGNDGAAWEPEKNHTEAQRADL